jgi:hypothetical protein
MGVAYRSCKMLKRSPERSDGPVLIRVEDGVMMGETLEGRPKGNNYIVYHGDKTRDFDLKRRKSVTHREHTAFVAPPITLIRVMPALQLPPLFQ